MGPVHRIEEIVASVVIGIWLLQFVFELFFKPKNQRNWFYAISSIWSAQMIAASIFVLPRLLINEQSLNVDGVTLVVVEALLAIVYFIFLGRTLKDRRSRHGQ